MDPAQVDQIVQAIGALQIGGQGTKKRLTPFSSAIGADWAVWRRNFQTIARINDWDQPRQKRELASSLEGLAAKTAADVMFEEPPLAAGAAQADIDARAAREAARTIDMVLDECEEKFLPPSESELAVAAFEDTAQASDESVMQWHARLRELHGRAYPGQDVNNRVLINRFALGLRDLQVREWTWKQRPATYAAALQHANNETASKAILGLAAGKPKGSQGIHAISAPKGRTGKGKSAGAGNCFFCERPGHFKAECRARMQWLAQQEKNRKKGGRKAINAMDGDDEEHMGSDLESPPGLTDDEGEESEN